MAEAEAEPISPGQKSPRKEVRDLAAELSEEQLNEAREVFNLFDKDGKPGAASSSFLLQLLAGMRYPSRDTWSRLPPQARARSATRKSTSRWRS